MHDWAVSVTKTTAKRAAIISMCSNYELQSTMFIRSWRVKNFLICNKVLINVNFHRVCV